MINKFIGKEPFENDNEKEMEGIKKDLSKNIIPEIKETLETKIIPEIKKEKTLETKIIPGKKGILDGSFIDKMEIEKNKSKRTLSSLIAERDKSINDRNLLGMPKGDKIISGKRKRLAKKIKDLNKKIDLYKASIIIDKGPVIEDDAKKFERLAKAIGYRNRSFSGMSRPVFDIEKANILEIADKFYSKPAKLITNYMIMASAAGSNFYQVLKGYDIELSKTKPQIENCVTKILIENGMKGIDMSSYISSPYLQLAIVLAMPLAMVVMNNKVLTKTPNTSIKNKIKKK